MQKWIIVMLMLCGLLLRAQAQQSENCVAAIGSRAAVGARVSINEQAMNLWENRSFGFPAIVEGVNGLVLDGPECANDQQYWHVFYNYAPIWVDGRALGGAALLSPTLEQATATANTPQSLLGVTVNPAASLGERLIATIPAQTENDNGFRHLSRQPFRVIAFPDVNAETIGNTNNWLPPAIYIFPNNGNLPPERIAQMEAVIAADGVIGEDFYATQGLLSIPSSNGANPMLAGGARVDVVAGRGFRYLTFFTQFVQEVPDTLSYVYQGFTADGDLVAAVFPVKVDYSGTGYAAYRANNPALITLDPGTEAAQAAYEAMMAAATQTLDTLPHSAFTPNLDDIDAMMRSLEVSAIPADAIYVSAACDPYPQYWQESAERTAPIAPSYLRAGLGAQRVGESASILRDAPDTSGQEVGRIPAGTRVQVLSDDPICAGDYAWFEVQYGDLRGYIAEGYGDTRWFVPVPPS